MNNNIIDSDEEKAALKEWLHQRLISEEEYNKRMVDLIKQDMADQDDVWWKWWI